MAVSGFSTVVAWRLHRIARGCGDATYVAIVHRKWRAEPIQANVRKEGETLQARLGNELRKMFAEIEATPIPRRLAALIATPDEPWPRARRWAAASRRGTRWILGGGCFPEGASCTEQVINVARGGNGGSLVEVEPSARHDKAERESRDAKQCVVPFWTHGRWVKSDIAVLEQKEVWPAGQVQKPADQILRWMLHYVHCTAGSSGEWLRGRCRARGICSTISIPRRVGENGTWIAMGMCSWKKWSRVWS